MTDVPEGTGTRTEKVLEDVTEESKTLVCSSKRHKTNNNEAAELRPQGRSRPLRGGAPLVAPGTGAEPRALAGSLCLAGLPSVYKSNRTHILETAGTDRPCEV